MLTLTVNSWVKVDDGKTVFLYGETGVWKNGLQKKQIDKLYNLDK